MHGSSAITFVAVLFFISVMLYRVKALHRKKIWHLSLQQIINLVLIPGLVFPMIFSYLQAMLRLPKSNSTFFPDSVLVSTILLSLMFSYGGIAIHAVTKMLSEYLKDKDSELAQINKFFHLSFSHNLIYSGIIISSLGITLLELNHIPDDGIVSVRWGIMRGLLLGVSFATFIYYYTRASSNKYRGKWGDLKFFFGIVWIGFALLLYVIEKFNIGFTEYQLLLPMLLSFSLVVGLSLILVMKKLKTGKLRLYFKKKITHILKLD
jgi:hypothetical protein